MFLIVYKCIASCFNTCIWLKRQKKKHNKRNLNRSILLNLCFVRLYHIELNLYWCPFVHWKLIKLLKRNQKIFESRYFNYTIDCWTPCTSNSFIGQNILIHDASSFFFRHNFTNKKCIVNCFLYRQKCQVVWVY